MRVNITTFAFLIKVVTLTGLFLARMVNIYYRF